MKTYLIVPDHKKWPHSISGVETVSAKCYVTNPDYSNEKNAKVINLASSFKYQTNGYYVSLLAAARGHKPLPTVQTIQDLKSPAMTKIVSTELDEVIQKSLGHIQSTIFTLTIYFGKNFAKCHDALAKALFYQYQAPLLQAKFTKSASKWLLTSINPLQLNEVPAEHQSFLFEIANDYFTKKQTIKKKKARLSYDLAILHNPNEQAPPSNPKALQKFLKAAETVGFNAELITKDDYSKIAQFDALFIRETTNVNHHTYKIARKAHMHGLIVIDDPDSILKCTNKVYLAELLQRHKIPAPKTMILHEKNLDEVENNLGFPCVIKQPDGAFSLGVTIAKTKQELLEKAKQLLQKSDLLIAQEFLPTEFDWRIGVLNGRAIFACRYFMARGHWQIYEHKSNGKTSIGRAETIPVALAPKRVVKAAIQASKAIGNGLYGVDIKECNTKPYVIEINDNPSIDAGVEDEILQDELYIKILEELFNRVYHARNHARSFPNIWN